MESDKCSWIVSPLGAPEKTAPPAASDWAETLPMPMDTLPMDLDSLGPANEEIAKKALEPWEARMKALPPGRKEAPAPAEAPVTTKLHEVWL